MTIYNETLCKNLKYLRNRLGISQETLSAGINLTRSTYVSYEKGTRTPDLQTLDALARLYEVSFDSLVNYDLTDGILNRIYFSSDDRELAELLNDYQALSVSSKYLLTQRLGILLDKEAALYADNLKGNTGIKK